MAVNREIYHNFLNRKVVVLHNSAEELIGYELVTFTPKYKRILSSYFTIWAKTAKEFLN